MDKVKKSSLSKINQNNKKKVYKKNTTARKINNTRTKTSKKTGEKKLNNNIIKKEQNKKEENKIIKEVQKKKNRTLLFLIPLLFSIILIAVMIGNNYPKIKEQKEIKLLKNEIKEILNDTNKLDRDKITNESITTKQLNKLEVKIEKYFYHY